MSRPIRLYCYPLFLSISESAKIKSKSVQNKAHKIIAHNKNKVVKIETLDQIRKKRVSLDIFRSLNVAWLLPLRDLFKRQAHKRHTRKRFASVITKGNNRSGKEKAAFQGALIFNGLPTDLRNEP